MSKTSAQALLVIDTQVGVFASAYRRSETIAAIRVVIEKARAASVPIIWVQHADEEMPLESEDWQIVSELTRDSAEVLVHKTFRSAFEQTNLRELLAEHSASHLIICGAETNNCIRHTAHSALEQGLSVTLVSDGHTTTGFEWGGFTVDAARTIDEQNTNFLNYELPGRTARAVTSADLVF